MQMQMQISPYLGTYDQVGAPIHFSPYLIRGSCLVTHQSIFMLRFLLFYVIKDIFSAILQD